MKIKGNSVSSAEPEDQRKDKGKVNIAVYCGSSPGNKEIFSEDIKKLGNWIGANGHTLVYGGCNTGLMGAIADSVLEAGGKVIGVLPDVPVIKARTHGGLTEYIETHTMAERKTKMIELSDAFIALPGGIGTYDEITEILSLSSLRIVKGPVIFYNTEGYYDIMKALLDNIVDNGFGKDEYFSRVLFSNDVEEIAKCIEG